MAVWRLSGSAEADIITLLARTEERFGASMRRRYEVLLAAGLREIAAEPERVGSVARNELGPGVRSYHLRHSRDHARTIEGFVRQPRHLILYRALKPDFIGFGRVLHDKMEMERHLPTLFGDE